MFSDNRKNLLVNLEKIQRRLCSYDNFSNDPTSEKPPVCDCKYGASGIGEQTGCPELRCILLLLENMSEKEFSKIIDKNIKHIALDKK